MFGLFLLIDIAFVVGNVTKIPSGGWVPLLLASLMFMGFITWRDGRAAAAPRAPARAVPWTELPSLLGERDEGTRHGRIPGEPQRLRADSDAAQPRAQPRLSRAHRDPASRDLAAAAPGPRGARVGRGAHAERARRARTLRLHGDARRERSTARSAPARPARDRRGLHVLPGLAPRARGTATRASRG